MTDNYLKTELYQLIQSDPSIFDFLQDGSLDGIWFWDLEHPENEWMSDRFWDLFGIDSATKDHKASEWQDIIFKEDLEVAIDNFNKHIADPNHPYDQVVRYRHASGRTVWVRCRGIAIRDENGKPIRMLGAHQDLTAQKTIEQKYKQEHNQLKEQNELIKKLPEQVPGVIYQYRYHPDGRNYFPFASTAIWDIYEVTPDDVKEDAKQVLERLHPEDYDRVMERILESFNTLEDWTDQYRVILPSRGERWLDGIAKPEKLPDDSVLWHGYITDITEKKQQEEEILYISNHDYLTGLYNRRYFAKKMQELQDSGTTPVAILMCDINGLKLINDAFGHYSGDILLTEAAKLIAQVCSSCKIVARVGGDEFAIILQEKDEAKVHQLVQQIHQQASSIVVQSVELSISIGFAIKDNKTSNLFEILKTAEDHMYRQKLTAIPSMRSNAIQTILTTLHEKDVYSENHSKRVSTFATRFARLIGMDYQTVKDIETAALLHDIGKIIIPISILTKITPLTEEERYVIRKHSEIGYRILNSSPEFRSISNIVFNIHEHFDGNGYPLGTKHEDIPIESRLIAITDAFEAMTSDRPYRQAMSHLDALLEIKRCAGGQFDPELAAFFEKYFDQITVD